MATDEDARTAARRIVEQVLSSRAPVTAASTSTALADEVVDDVVIELTGELDVADPVAVVEDVAEDLAADAHVAVDEVDATDPRARARALVAEVLAAHAARTSSPEPVAQPDDAPDAVARPDDAPDPVAQPDDAPEPVGEDEELLFGRHRLEPPAPPTAPEEGASRSRARELVAEALADAEEREAAARAAAEAREAEERAAAEAAARAEAEAAAEREREREAARRIEEARRAEAARAEAERARQAAIERERREEAERLERERERAEAEAREREAWAAADRDAAAATTPVDVRTGDDHTVPMSVAELAASGHPDEDPDGDLDRTALVANDPAGATALVRQDRTDAGAGTLALPRDELERATAAPAARSAEVVDHDPVPVDDPVDAPVDADPADADPAAPKADPRVLEAVVDLDTPLPPARGGRWLLVSVIGAITLAIVFPLAIRALLQLVALS